MAAAADAPTGDSKTPVGPRVLPADTADDTPADPYYWEEGANDDVPTTTAVMHNLHWWGSLALAGVDSVGGVLASGLGLTQSRYQFEIDYAQRQREQIRSRIIARRQRDLLVLEERRRRGAAAGGAPADSRSVEKAVSDRIELERTARARERAERGEEEEEEGDADKTFFEAAAEAEARAERETAAAVAPSASGPAPKGAASAV